MSDAVPEVPVGHSRWEPREDGWLHLRVGSPELLEALAAREEERRRSRMTGEHPVMVTRPTAPYLLVGARRGGGPGGAAVAALMRSCALYRVQDGGSGSSQRFLHAGDVATVVSQVRDAVGPDGWVLPLIGPEGRRGLPVLRGVLLCGVRGPGRLGVATRTGVWGMRLREPGSLRSLPRVLRVATGAASVWTSVVPTAADDAALLEGARTLAACLGVTLSGLEGARTLAACLGVTLSGLEAHEESRSEGAVGVGALHGLRHVTVEVGTAVPGPVSLGGSLLAPVGASGLAVGRAG